MNTSTPIGPYHVRNADGRQGVDTFPVLDDAIADAGRRTMRDQHQGCDAPAWFAAESLENDRMRVGWRRVVIPGERE